MLVEMGLDGLRLILTNSMRLQVEDLTSLLLGDSDDGASSASSWEETQSSASAPQAFVMGFSSLMLDLSSLRPRAEKASFLWDIFVKKVDPHCKILHKPTMQKIINQSGGGPATMAKNMDPLVFSIYLAAVAKLSSDDCKKYLLEDKNTLLSRYRFAAEQALARAEFLSSAEVSTLQALVVFMVSDDHRKVFAVESESDHRISRCVFINWKTPVSYGLS